jgi:hypothetical protein
MKALLLVIGLLALSACGKDKEGEPGKPGGAAAKPTPGDACSTDAERVCLSPEEQAICQGGQWRSFPCDGPDACSTSGGTTTCDISGNKADDKCAAADSGKSACAAGGKELVSCVDGRIQRQACRGPKGCAEDGDKTACDMTINSAGEACTTEGSASCSLDQKEQLNCKNGTWISTAPCRGPRGCYLAEEKIWCDQSLAKKGEVCLHDGAGTCTMDSRAELICKNGRWTMYYAGACRY